MLYSYRLIRLFLSIRLAYQLEDALIRPTECRRRPVISKREAPPGTTGCLWQGGRYRFLVSHFRLTCLIVRQTYKSSFKCYSSVGRGEKKHAKRNAGLLLDVKIHKAKQMEGGARL